MDKDILSAHRQYVVIGSGESYNTAITTGDKLLRVVEEFLFGEVGSGGEQFEAWATDIKDPDNWCHDPDLGPVSFSEDVGETDHLDIYLLSPR